MNEAFHRNDIRKLQSILESYQKNGPVQTNAPISCVLDENGHAKTNNRGILSAFETKWKKIFCSTKDQQEIKEFDTEAAASGDYNPICDDSITVQEVTEALKPLENGKSAGLDDIPPALITDKSQALVKVLTYVFNEILSTGKFPEDWKQDRRCPLHKSGRKSDVDRYRLIAIHSVFRKVFCTILQARMRTFVQIDDAQNGFRPNRRCTDNILLLNSTMSQQIKNKKGAFVIVIDFSKAFDSCHIPTLFRKLSKKGVRGNILRTIVDMYTGAKCQMFVNGTLGTPFEVHKGVAQGCVLSPLFFDIYVDDLLEEFRDSELGIPIGQFLQGATSFADDLALLATDKESSIPVP